MSRNVIGPVNRRSAGATIRITTYSIRCSTPPTGLLVAEVSGAILVVPLAPARPTVTSAGHAEIARRHSGKGAHPQLLSLIQCFVDPRDRH